MRLLIITENVGETAPGIVFERLIQGLSIDNDVSVLTASLKTDVDLSKLVKIIISPKLQIHRRIFQLLISLFGFNPFDRFWALKSIHRLKKQTKPDFDIVMSFLSYSHFAGLIAGYNYSKRFKINHAVYSVDAIPPPVGWLKLDLYYRGLQRMMKKYLSSASFFFSLNPQMLNYQLKTFNTKKPVVSGVIYTSGLDSKKVFSNPTISKTHNFVYTGGIYGLRKADYILIGFQKLIQIYPDSKLQFIGTQLLPEHISAIKSGNFKNIEIIPFTRNLDPYYKDATALIDIDADLENDVFLSSKMPNYLMINRIIISETGINSPSRHLFKGINSIIQCDHDADHLYFAMKWAIESKRSVSFDDRESVIQLFQLNNIIKKLNNTLLMAESCKNI